MTTTLELVLAAEQQHAAEREHTAIGHVVRHLQDHFPATDPDHVRAVVHGIRHRFDGARVRTYVPVLVEHAARDRLEGRAGSRSSSTA